MRPDETSVVLGEGMLDIPGILRAANADGVKYHFIEDEHPEAEKQIPRSLEYLARLEALSRSHGERRTTNDERGRGHRADAGCR
jgi:hypothetical protein